MPQKSAFEVGQMDPILRVIKTLPLSADALWRHLVNRGLKYK